MKDSDQQVLIQYRMEQARAALEEADVLFSLGKTTFGAINRAYYAMFYSVLALLQQIGKIPRKHSGVLALFDSEFVKKGVFPKALSRHLHNAFESRQVSDYQVMEPICRDEAEEIIRNALTFVQTMEEYLKKSPND
ncbi:MAG: HEPN domain-containing protein [Pseudomonadota bacterium]